MSAVSPQMDTFTASDGYVTHYRRYLPADLPRAHLICLHGVQSHGGWYEYSCSRLCQAGYAVHYLDRRGSGLNPSGRGDTPSFRRLLMDIGDFIFEVQGPASPIPVVLLAVSWGGKLAAAFCRRSPGWIDGLVLMCPGIFPKVSPATGQRLSILWSRLVKPSRMFPIPLNDPKLFTATPHWQEFIANDPLALHEATARFFVESVRLDGYLRFVPSWVNVPTLLMLAEQDQIINNTWTRGFFQQLATSDKQVLEYGGAHHTLEFEPNPDRFIDDLIAWLRNHEKPFVQGRQKVQGTVHEISKVLNPGAC